MLKVVGASSLQTRISWCIVQGMILLGVLTFFYGIIPRSQDDGKYAATVFWNRETGKFDIKFWGQNNEPNTVRRGAARAYYQPDMSTTGWATLEIETNEAYPDKVQAFSAGMLEGSLSWLYIYWHWKNTVQSICINEEEFCDYVREFLLNNTESIRINANKLDKVDSFWHQINLFYIQLDGLEYGWKFEVGRNKKEYEIPHLDFLWMNIMPDMKDFRKKFNISQSLDRDNYRSSSMALLKLIPKQERYDFLVAHASSGLYSSMLRTRKKYSFGYHRSGKPNSQVVSGRNIRFSSYPASIHSQDDFYQIKFVNEETVTIVGSTLHNYNPNNLHFIDSRKHVLIGLRIMASNRLSRDGNSWSRLMAKFNSGTGNKQWLHIHTREARNVTLWVTEQMPGEVVSNDETETLINKGHWISYGIPYYREIQEISAHDEKTEKAKFHVVLYNLLVRKVLQNGQQNVTDVDSLLYLMRGPDLTLAGRTDLHEEDLTTWSYYLNATKNFEKDSRSFDDELKRNRSNEVNVRRSNAENENNEFNRFNNSVFAPVRNAISIKPIDHENDRKYINLEHNAFNMFYVEYNTTVNKIFTLRHLILLYNPTDFASKLNRTKIKRINEHSTFSNLDTRNNEINRRINFKPFTNIPTKQKERIDIDGVIDLKITNNNDDFIAAAGPPFTIKNNEPISIAPFQWSKSRIKYLPHNGHTDVWNYLPIVSEWKWN